MTSTRPRVAWPCAVLCVALAIVNVPTARAAAPTTGPAGKYEIGRLDDAISESSGIVASRKYAGVYWTHNDSGNAPELFAVTREGRLLARYAVAAKNVDWEDIAIDDAGHLYVADVGNNAKRADRTPIIYQIAEPDPTAAAAAAAVQAPLAVRHAFSLRYAPDPFDCEAVFVWRDHGYLVSKQRDGAFAQLFRFPLANLDRPSVLEPVAQVPMRSPVTAADISADGKELLLLSVFGPNRYRIDGDPTKAAIATPNAVGYLHPNLEAATFAPGGIIATTEQQQVLFFTDDLFGNARKAAIEADEATKITINAPTGPIVIDGVLTDWTDANRQPLQSVPADAPDAASAMLYLAWQPDGLLLAARVPRPSPRPLAAEWFGGDVIELFIGRHATDRAPEFGDGDDRCYLGFEPTPGDGSRGNAVIRWPRRTIAPPDSRVAGVVDAGGGNYTIEAFLPATALVDGQPLSAGQVMRLEVTVLARQPNANWYITTPNAAGAWMSPLKWAIATLK